jgi:hypothetical protein
VIAVHMTRPGAAAHAAAAPGWSFDAIDIEFVDLLLIPSPAPRALSNGVAAIPLMSARSAWS